MDTSHDTKKLSKSKLVFSKLKRKFLKNIWFARSVIILLVLVVLFVSGIGVGKLLSGTPLARYMTLASDFAFLPATNLASISGKTNIAVLGKGGQGHDAPDLTDTVMFASIDLINPKIQLVSFPRDIWVPDLRAKLNSAYYWGNQKQENGGLPLAKSTIEQITGQPVHYAVVIDFSGFKDIIDNMGGIEVYVENSFIDQEFPIPGKENDLCGGDKTFACRYESIEFKQGLQKMDGETALKFVRSRHADGDEGTDIARSARQQSVISAMKAKLLSKDILFHPAKVLAVANAVRSSIETDLTDSNLVVLARVVFFAKDNLTTYVLPQELLQVPAITSKHDYQYVFVPTAGTWEDVHKWVKANF